MRTQWQGGKGQSEAMSDHLRDPFTHSFRYARQANKKGPSSEAFVVANGVPPRPYQRDERVPLVERVRCAKNGLVS